MSPRISLGLSHALPRGLLSMTGQEQQAGAQAQISLLKAQPAAPIATDHPCPLPTSSSISSPSCSQPLSPSLPPVPVCSPLTLPHLPQIQLLHPCLSPTLLLLLLLLCCVDAGEAGATAGEVVGPAPAVWGTTGGTCTRGTSTNSHLSYRFITKCIEVQAQVPRAAFPGDAEDMSQTSRLSFLL